MKNRLLKAIRDALFPENFTCELCGREIFHGGRLCDECYIKVAKNDGATCPACGRRTKIAALCLECKAEAPSYDRAVSAFVYGEGTTRLIHKFKNGGAYLKGFFAPPLAEKCKLFPDAEAICYIPMTKEAEVRRGYNQAKLLAKELCEITGLPLLESALEKLRETKEQKSLTMSQRGENLRGSFRADGCVKGKRLIVVDDVMTTGATANAAAEVLKRRGAKRVYIATAASVEYKDKTLGEE